MKSNSLVIVSNERIFKDKEIFFCDNIEMKSLPEGLNNFHNLIYIARTSKAKRSHVINISKIKIASNIFSYILLILKTLKIPNAKYLIIAITPYTFFSFLIFFLFRKKPFLWLRSSGHEEYKFILGHWASWIYHIMYSIVTSYSNVISCHERLFKKSHKVIFPSQLDDNWFKNQKKAPLDKIRLLYVGRNNPEKGIENFLKMFNQLKIDIQFSIVSEKKKLNINNKNINFLGYGFNSGSLINIYDDSNILILPSFTESYSQVIDESLSRRRPVIIFEEIEYIVGNRVGIFITKRNLNSLSETMEFIIKNYISIQESIDKNNLPTKEKFILQMNNILS
jgi:glycosyltransferase involved in cell wall biosynthesis|tara:strand:+ start:642 stop:1652 length:1011 start_codon:yes stop_codon:yes gene_type:complete